MPPSRLINRNVQAGGGRTSMRLEPELWDALGEICGREGLALGELVRQVERDHSGRTSAVRVYALSYFRHAATEEGHQLAGHGPKPRESALAVATRSDHLPRDID